MGSIIGTLKSKYIKLCRKYWGKRHRKDLKVSDFSIISQSCWGGVILEEMHMQFTSPTAGLLFKSEDFLKFTENLEHYLTQELVEVTGPEYEALNVSYPVAKLDDILVFFVHYPTFEIAAEKWYRRAKRVNYDRIYVGMTARDAEKDGYVERFSKLPYPKVMFTPHKREKDFCVYLPGFEADGEYFDTGKIVNWKGQRISEVNFDVIDWLNKGYKKSQED